MPFEQDEYVDVVCVRVRECRRSKGKSGAELIETGKDLMEAFELLLDGRIHELHSMSVHLKWLTQEVRGHLSWNIHK